MGVVTRWLSDGSRRQKGESERVRERECERVCAQGPGSKEFQDSGCKDSTRDHRPQPTEDQRLPGFDSISEQEMEDPG